MKGGLTGQRETKVQYSGGDLHTATSREQDEPIVHKGRTKKKGLPKRPSGGHDGQASVKEMRQPRVRLTITAGHRSAFYPLLLALNLHQGASRAHRNHIPDLTKGRKAKLEKKPGGKEG